MSSAPETPEPREDVAPADVTDLDVSAEEADAVKGGAVSSKLPDGKPIGH